VNGPRRCPARYHVVVVACGHQAPPQDTHRQSLLVDISGDLVPEMPDGDWIIGQCGHPSPSGGEAQEPEVHGTDAAPSPLPVRHQSIPRRHGRRQQPLQRLAPHGAPSPCRLSSACGAVWIPSNWRTARGAGRVPKPDAATRRPWMPTPGTHARGRKPSAVRLPAMTPASSLTGTRCGCTRAMWCLPPRREPRCPSQPDRGPAMAIGGTDSGLPGGWRATESRLSWPQAGDMSVVRAAPR